ncbi:MAG: N-acetylglucosamine kinase [Ferruginibacter sp.]|nr:N-acetylglucosamine kinase [Ferruginibacter sp.]
MPVKLIADSGSTKTDWCLLSDNKKIKIVTQGISPYFLTEMQIQDILSIELLPKLKKYIPDEIYFYGTGCSNPKNQSVVKTAIRAVFPNAKTHIDHDLSAAAKALCGNEKGIACILGTGSNSCYYNGKKIAKNSPGIGFILGDEGSGAHMGKKVLQYFLYKTFDPDLMDRFKSAYSTDTTEILESVYKKPLPNRYLANFTGFLVENRGHFMVENIIEDSLNDFFFNHICKYSESWKYPIHFVGSVAYGFRDVIENLCQSYELTQGKIMRTPMDGLIQLYK